MPAGTVSGVYETGREPEQRPFAPTFGGSWQPDASSPPASRRHFTCWSHCRKQREATADPVAWWGQPQAENNPQYPHFTGHVRAGSIPSGWIIPILFFKEKNIPPHYPPSSLAVSLTKHFSRGNPLSLFAASLHPRVMVPPYWEDGTWQHLLNAGNLLLCSSTPAPKILPPRTATMQLCRHGAEQRSWAWLVFSHLPGNRGRQPGSGCIASIICFLRNTWHFATPNDGGPGLHSQACTPLTFRRPPCTGIPRNRSF